MQQRNFPLLLLRWRSRSVARYSPFISRSGRYLNFGRKQPCPSVVRTWLRCATKVPRDRAQMSIWYTMVFNPLRVKLGRSVSLGFPSTVTQKSDPRCLLFCHIILYTHSRCPILNIYFQAYFRCSRYSAPAPHRRICPPQSEEMRSATKVLWGSKQAFFSWLWKMLVAHWCSVVIEVDMSADTETSAYPTTQDEGIA